MKGIQCMFVWQIEDKLLVSQNLDMFNKQAKNKIHVMFNQLQLC